MTAQVTPIRGRRITMRDDSAAHQIRLQFASGNKIAVSCTCMATSHAGAGTRFYEPIEVRGRWEPHEPMDVWRAHMAEVAR